MRQALAVFAFVLTACNTAEPMTTSSTSAASTARSWRLEITTSGGITGRGLGGVTIDGANVVATDASIRTCRTELTSAERAELDRLAAAARPDGWRDVPPTPGSADMIEYRMNLRRGDESREMTWSGEDVSRLPKDAASLFGIAWTVRDRALQSCR